MVGLRRFIYEPKPLLNHIVEGVGILLPYPDIHMLRPDVLQLLNAAADQAALKAVTSVIGRYYTKPHTPIAMVAREAREGDHYLPLVDDK